MTVAAGATLAIGLRWLDANDAAGRADATTIGSPPSLGPATTAHRELPASRYTGVAVSDRILELTTPVAGWLRWRAGDVGGSIDAYAPVAEIDSDRVVADVRRAAADLAAAEADVAVTRAELLQADERLGEAEQLAQVLAAEELRAARTAADVAKSRHWSTKAALEARRAALQEVSAEQTLHLIRAPFESRLSLQYLQDGAWVPAGAQIARLIARAEPTIRFAVPPDEQPQIGHHVVVELGDVSVEASVTSIAPQIDEPTGLVFVNASLDGPPRGLQHGQVVKVSMRPAAPD